MLGSTTRHLSREPTNKAIVHLILLNWPSDTLVHGIPIPDNEEPSPLEWNFIANGDLIPWYMALFTFLEAYLEDDTGMVVLMSCELYYELYKLAQKVGFEVKAEWIFNQFKPQVHSNFLDMMVSF